MNRQAGAALLVAFLLLAVVGGTVVASARRADSRTPPGPPTPDALDDVRHAHRDGDRRRKRVTKDVTEDVPGNSQAVAWGLYRDYLLPFEVASVFLLVAMIGAVVLGKRTMEHVD